MLVIKRKKPVLKVKNNIYHIELTKRGKGIFYNKIFSRFTNISIGAQVSGGCVGEGYM